MPDPSSVIRLLDAHYGRRQWTAREPIIDELVLTILSQNTTAANCRAAYGRLRERLGEWEQVRLATWEEIADSIRPAGLANRRAPRIRRILEDIHDRQGSLDLEWIAGVDDRAAMDYLMAFDGVGRKTAACVLMFGLGRPVLPVDTHVHRVARRLGLISEVSAERAHDLLAELIPRQDVYSFHVNTVTHGREVCRAIGPRCGACVLTGECDYFAKCRRTHSPSTLGRGSG